MRNNVECGLCQVFWYKIPNMKFVLEWTLPLSSKKKTACSNPLLLVFL